MSDTFQELADIPKVHLPSCSHAPLPTPTSSAMACNSSTAAPSVSLTLFTSLPKYLAAEIRNSPLDIVFLGIDGLTTSAADKREFLKISQAVGVGFVIMGAIGYFVKLIHIPVNNVLVG
uniref:Protein transport protein Sec61 subunit gamma n=1 Tax=Talaromyces marneffei PM1 TaxID=1077442 RepID=A0A093XWH9_TALMA